MKNVYAFLALLSCTLFPFQVVAGWEPTKIKYIQMANANPVVYVYFESKITHSDCADPDAAVAGGATLRKTGSFDELYARLLIAEQTNQTIQVLSTAGTCNQNFWVDSPYIRFESN